VSPISRPRSASFGTSRAPSTTACFFAAPLRRTSSSTLMMTGSIVPTLADPLRATQCSWVTTSSPDPRSVKTSSLVQALRRSTATRPTAWQRRVGFVRCLWNYTTLYHGPLWSTATTSAPSTSPPTPSNTSAPSMSRLIYTLSVSALSSGTFVSSTSRRFLSSPTSPPRHCPPRYSQSFGSVSTTAVSRVHTGGGRGVVREPCILSPWVAYV
jgi:hypothetical protein